MRKGEVQAADDLWTEAFLSCALKTDLIEKVWPGGR
jgi:hypothetical protein